MRRSNITNYKDIIRLHRSGDYSNREIAKILGVSRNTISACFEKIKEKEMTIPLPKAMSNEEISALEKPRRLLKKVDPPRHTDTYYDTDITNCPDNTYNTDITD